MNKYEYTPTAWIGGKTIGTADVMNNIEEGIMKAHEELEEVNSQLEHIITFDTSDLQNDIENYNKEGKLHIRSGVYHLDNKLNLVSNSIISGLMNQY